MGSISRPMWARQPHDGKVGAGQVDKPSDKTDVPAQLPEWLSTRRAEKYLGMRHGALTRVIERGEIQGYRRGNAVIVNRAEIEAWINRQWYPHEQGASEDAIN